MATSLERDQLPEIKLDNFTEAEQELASKVGKLFGYHQLTKAVVAKPPISDCGPALLQAMRDHDIRPFRQDSVVTYMRQKEREEHLRNPGERQAAITFVAGLVLLVLGAAGLLAWLGCAAVYGWTATITCWMYGAWIPVLAAAAISSIVCCNTTVAPITCDWFRRGLSEYTGHVPTYALQSAVDLKEAVPGCHFFVEELRVTQERRTARMGPDPFLVVMDNRQREYYIEVWDEPGFDRRRIA